MSCRTHNCLTHCPVLTRGVLQLGRNLHVSLDHWSASLTSSVLELDQNELQQVAALTCFSVLARRQSCSVSRGCAARSQVLPPLPLPVMMKWKLCCTGVSNAEETCFSRSPTLCFQTLCDPTLPGSRNLAVPQAEMLRLQAAFKQQQHRSGSQFCSFSIQLPHNKYQPFPFLLLKSFALQVGNVCFENYF